MKRLRKHPAEVKMMKDETKHAEVSLIVKRVNGFYRECQNSPVSFIELANLRKIVKFS